MQPTGRGDAAKTVGVPSKVMEEAVEALLDPCADSLDMCEFLPPWDDSPLARSLCQAAQRALMALAAAADSARTKRLVSAVLGKTRSDDAEVRLAAVRCCHCLWKELGVQVVSSLSDVVMFASELLEDEDFRVEEAVRSLVKTMEECTGESLQDSLKR